MTMQTVLWVLCAVGAAVVPGGADCPLGARTHLSSLRCLWLSQGPAAWPEAVGSCTLQGGDVANAGGGQLQMFISQSFPVEESEWIWVRSTRGDTTPSWQDGRRQRGGACVQMTLGTLRESRTSACDGHYRFLCEKTVTDLLPSADSFLTGVVLMSAVHPPRQVQVLPRPPDVGPQTVEMQLFPGLWFSHAGQLSSVEMVVQPSAELTQARVQVLRPYCSPDRHLVPPGCVSLLNPFSACSAVPLCNTTGGCGPALHWCPLLETCVPSTRPCSAYDPAAQARGFTVPPRHGAGTPFYHVAADLPLTITPSQEPTALTVLLPSKPIMVYPDDIVAFQHTRASGTFLHCRAPITAADAAWRQSYLSLSGPEWGGWRDGALTSLPSGSQWVDGVVCDFKMTYVDLLHHATEFSETFGYGETTISDIPGPFPSLRPKLGLTVIHPVPDENKVHVQINVPIRVVVKTEFGDGAKSLWSGPVLQSDGAFSPFCPKEVAQTLPGCVETKDVWFSSATLLVRLVGEQTLSVTVVRSRTWERLDLRLLGYEAVTGLSVEPRGCTRIIVDNAQTFAARVESGTSVQFTWAMDDQLSFTHQEPLYRVTLKDVARHTLTVTASNPVSSQTASLVLTADEGFPLSQPEFLYTTEVAVVGSTQRFSLRVKADVSLPITFRWDLGSSITHLRSALCETDEGLVDRGVKHTYVQDSVSYSFLEPGDFTLTVQVTNQQSKLDVSKKISIRQKLLWILASSLPVIPLVNQTVLLEASTEPYARNITYTWDFGDSSSAVQDSKITHNFGSLGLYNITISANNSISIVTSWILVEVMEKITGLTISRNGPTEVNSPMDFKAKVATGTGLIWKYDFGDGSYQENLTHGSTFHSYRSPSNYTVGITVSNSVSELFLSTVVEVYKLEISGILPTTCVLAGQNIHLMALVNGNISTLTFHWLFGDGAPLKVVTGNSTTQHIFKTQGFYHLNLTAISAVTSVSYSARLCVERLIANVAIKLKKDAVAVGEEVCFEALVNPDFPTGLRFKWTVSSFTTTTESKECFVFNEEGYEEIKVMASNSVSNRTAKAWIAIQRPVEKLLVQHGSPNSTSIVHSKLQFWITNCDGSNVTILWDFGDGSGIESSKNVSHVFTSTGQYIVTATAYNLVSQESVSVQVSVLPPVSGLSIHTEESYVATGELTVFKAVSRSISSTKYYWTVVGITPPIQGTYEFRFTFTNPATYLVKVVAQNLMGTGEAAFTINVLERIEDLEIGCASLTEFKYIPAREKVQFDAFASKGSNITYHWLVIQNVENLRVKADGDIFYLTVERTGEIVIKLTATNKLGKASSSISVVAMERVHIANMDDQKRIVPFGELVNISVAVLAGSDLHFSWYINSDSAPIQTHVPFLLHNCTKLGVVSIVVSVQNVLSQSNVSKLLVVQEEIQDVGFTVEGKMAPFYVKTDDIVSFSGHIKKGSDLHWLWKIQDYSFKHEYASNEIFTHTFRTEGTYLIALNVSNELSWKMVISNVTVQDGIEGLVLDASKSTFCRAEKVTFTPTILQGTNVSYAIAFKSNDVIQTYDFVEEFIISSLAIGKHLVTIKAWNLVSFAEVSATFVVIEHIQGLRIANCCTSSLEAFKDLVFMANVENMFSVNYTWIFEMEGYTQTRLLGQKVFYNAPNSGILRITVEASNGGCSAALTEDANVEFPVNTVELSCDFERVFLNYMTTFTAKANGSNLTYQWDFGDLTKPVLMNKVSKVNHTYDRVGDYVVTVTVVNNVSKASKQLMVEVGKIECSSPQVSIVPNRYTIFKARLSYFEAIVRNNCSAYKTGYTWDIFACPNLHSTGKRMNFQTNMDATSPFLKLPKNSLDVGQYCLIFTAFLKGTPMHVQQNATITVVHSPLVAAIQGGSNRVWPSNRDLVLDGAKSQDPDVEQDVENELEYDWTIHSENSSKRRIEEVFGRHSSKMTVNRSQLYPGAVHVFTLTVYKAGRKPVSVNQTVLVSDTAVPVTVECTSCPAQSLSHFSSTRPLTLYGQCEVCTNEAQYQWSVRDAGGRTFDMNEVSSGLNSPKMVMRSGALDPGRTYTFSLRVYEPGRSHWGRSSLTLQPSRPPHGGLCELSPVEPILALDTVVTCNCSEWQPDDSEGGAPQLIYSLQVVSCESDRSCPVLTLYRGIQSVFGSVLPFGRQSEDRGTSPVTVLVLIEDHLGTRVTALNRTVEVRNPVDKDGEWLRNKIHTELWPIVQHGNPQEIIPYSMVLSSRLNQVEPRNDMEVQERREMRQNVTRALTSLSVTSLDDAAQISSALMHSTAVPSELASAQCQESVLEAVGRMIRVMEAPSEDEESAVQTGRNVLSVIGNTLAAVSKSEPAPLASTLSLSALRHTSSVMRSLTVSRAQSNGPLSISTPRIRALAFHGDPSDFLCTGKPDRPAHPCRFQIPNSLTRRLAGRNPRLVQVILEVGDALAGNPLLTSADPPISTDVVAMEVSAPGGRPVSVRGLGSESGIRVKLPRKHEARRDDDRTCFVTALCEEERRRNITLKDLDKLDTHAGLYVSFSFSLDSGAAVESEGQVLVEVLSAASPGPLATLGPISVTPPTPSTESTIFISPLLNGTDSPLLFSLSAPVLSGGPVRVSVCVFSSLCRFYDEARGVWSSEGLRPLEGATLQQAHCLSEHLTMFGASLFLHPGAVLLLPPPGGPVRTIVPGLVVAVLALLHLLLGLISHRLDHWDRVRLSQVPLCGRPGLYHYRLLLKTGRRPGAGTTAHVGISLYGVAHSGSRHLQREGAFQRGGLDLFHLETEQSLGEVWKIRLWHDNTGLEPSWFVQHVVVWDLQTDNMFFFLVDGWLSVENFRHGGVEREVLASCPDELGQFRRVLSSQLQFGLVDRHLWVSVWERPAHSHFTRGQRVSCCALSLHLYLALGALWYGAVGWSQHSGPVSALVLVNMETVAVGMTLALLLFPLQCLLCFLFGKTYIPVTVDLSVPPSPMCHSVEMDVCLDQSRLSGPSFMSLPGSSPAIRDSPSSLLLDSSILDLWACSGLMSQSDSEEALWPSCDSLLSDPPALSEEPATRQLRRKKALSQRHMTTATSRAPRCPPISQTQAGYMTTLLTLSDENLMMSIAAAEDSSPLQKNNSDSGRDSPTTASPLSAGDTCGSGWSEDAEGRCLSLEDTGSCDGALYRSMSEASLDSTASTVLPSPSPDSTRCSSTTRIGVARASPGWLLPSWTLRVVYPLVAVSVIACMAVVGLYGSFFPRTVLLMWLVSTLSAALSSALLLEPFKVCVQAVLCSALWRPVDPEVEERLAHETSVVRPFTEHSADIRPPCGYGLLQAKQKAHKVRTLTSLMRHCVGQLLFLMLVLMFNYQAHVELQNGRLLHSASKQHLHRAPVGVPNLTTLTGWSEAEQWVRAVLVPHLHERPSMRLVGLPWLQFTDALGSGDGLVLGNTSETTLQLLSELSMDRWNHRQYNSLSVQWTHYHIESGLWLCGHLRLHLTHLHKVSGFLSLDPLLLPPSGSAWDLQLALPVLLVLCGLLMLGAELYSARTEREQPACPWSRCFHFLLASLSVATGVIQLHFLSLARHCLSQLRHQPERYISFHSAALLSQRSSECAAILLTLLVLRLLGTLRFVRRWVVMGRVLHRACGELWALALLLTLTLLLCAHLANAVFSHTVEGFVSVHQAFVSVLSTLRGHRAVRGLYGVHPYLGCVFSLLLRGGALWLLARVCGAVLIRAYRSERAEMFRPTIEPQDYEMVEFFIKRLKLWIGLTKTKEFRHRVKFEGMNVPPSRSSRTSRPSTVSSSLSPFRSPSPRPLSSSLSARSEDSALSEVRSDVPPHLDRLQPSVAALLAQFDRVNQITEDVYRLETKLEDAQIKRHAARMQERLDKLGDGQPKMSEVRQRRSGVLYLKALQPSPLSIDSYDAISRTRNSLSESESFPHKPHLRRNTFGAAKPASVGNSRSMSPASGSEPPLPRRRAWHSGSSHSADAAQRILQSNAFCKDGRGFGRPRSEEGARRWALDGIPIKRKAWISEGVESEEE